MGVGVGEPRTRSGLGTGGGLVNDFSIHVATINGSGSQSSNTVLLRSLFYMGIPVSGKNLFPSNIAGLPTWFTIRVSKDGYLGREVDLNVLVCMNPQTIKKDVESLAPGATVIYDKRLAAHQYRDDLIFYAVPLSDLVKEVCPVAKLRKLVVNMVYVGVLAGLYDIEEDALRMALEKQFTAKPKAVAMNWDAILKGKEYALEQLHKQDSYRVERMDANGDKFLVDGNTATALGAIYGGCSVLTWYPITPSSSLGEAMIGYFKQLRHDPETGKATYAVVQAEDELAAIGMVVGAGWAGARAMTATSGPGISLMSEFVGYAYYAEIPGVIVNVQRLGPSTGLPTRLGPSTGLPTRTAQGDIGFCYNLSHGDTRHVCLIPSSVEECFEYGWRALSR